MSRLTELIRQTKERDPELGAELEREFRTLSGRRAFGLNFERHRPEAVELPGRPVRRGDKVRVLPERGSTERGDERLWRVRRIEGKGAKRRAHLEPIGDDDREATMVSADDLVVVAEFRDPIHPGLVPTGGVRRGGDKPAHTVINGENFHVLKALTFTHRGKVDAIYIDPPYNTGARDWKYNNDYVESDDLYRHSKWLAFMERRLLLAKELLNPENSVLIVTIDEKEYLRLGLLLEQVFPEAQVQMVTTVTNPGGSTRSGKFSRTDEYIYIVYLGSAVIVPGPEDMLTPSTERKSPSVQWHSLVRHQASGLRTARPNLFYPIYIRAADSTIESVGEALPLDRDRSTVPNRPDTVPVFPLYQDGREGTWAMAPASLRAALEEGFVRPGTLNAETGRCAIYYLKGGKQDQIRSGEIEVVGRDDKGAVVVRYPSAPVRAPKTTWKLPSHNARSAGSDLVRDLLGGRSFPFPKSLYAVEDALRFFVSDKPDAVVLDFFAGSGTTTHAVMRLNRQDGGQRQCISVTNNEVSADEQKRLRADKLRPGDPEWEALGICDHITKPRIEAAITGRTPDGEPIKGDYKFTDEFPMAEGFEENAEFFTLTYENPVAVGHNRSFERVAPLLWLRAGAEGRLIDKVPEAGWDVADTYGIVFDLDAIDGFTQALTSADPDRLRIAFVVTDDDRRFQAAARHIPDGVVVVRLYESYLSNFRFTGVEP